MVGQGKGWIRTGAILRYQGGWEGAQKTEKSALEQCEKFFPQVPGVLYLGFPWSTLIGQLECDLPLGKRLLAALADLDSGFFKDRELITVCSHPGLLKYQKIFADAGVKHVFWSHTDNRADRFQRWPEISLYPFPLVSEKACEPSRHGAGRRTRLFTFIDVSRDNVLRGSWNLDVNLSLEENSPIVEEVRGLGKTESDLGVLGESVFSLCPPRPGLSPLLLWESIELGAIPVLFPGNFLLPGDQRLWGEATVSCSGAARDIRALPERLAVLGNDVALLERKRHALRQVRMLYGADCFIYDVLKLSLSLADWSEEGSSCRPGLSYDGFSRLAKMILAEGGDNKQLSDLFIIGCSSRASTNPGEFVSHFKKNDDLRKAYRIALEGCDRKHANVMEKVLGVRKIDLSTPRRK